MGCNLITGHNQWNNSYINTCSRILTLCRATPIESHPTCILITGFQPSFHTSSTNFPVQNRHISGLQPFYSTKSRINILKMTEPRARAARHKGLMNFEHERERIDPILHPQDANTSLVREMLYAFGDDKNPSTKLSVSSTKSQPISS